MSKQNVSETINESPESQKGHCEDCPLYTNCPRMRGDNYCASTPGNMSNQKNIVIDTNIIDSAEKNP